MGNSYYIVPYSNICVPQAMFGIYMTFTYVNIPFLKSQVSDAEWSSRTHFRNHLIHGPGGNCQENKKANTPKKVARWECELANKSVSENTSKQ